MPRISKNRDVTRLINFRLRETDLEQLDRHAKANQLSRTAALERLINNNCQSDCTHEWMTFGDGTKVCKHCKENDKVKA